jgi:hypothetical protein
MKFYNTIIDPDDVRQEEALEVIQGGRAGTGRKRALRQSRRDRENYKKLRAIGEWLLHRTNPLGRARGPIEDGAQRKADVDDWGVEQGVDPD